MKKIFIVCCITMLSHPGCNKISRFIENKMYDTFKKQAAADVKGTSADTKEKTEEEASCH